MNSLRVVVLAAGKGTRLKSGTAKVLHRVGGLPMIEHVVRSARAISRDVWLIVGHQADRVRAAAPACRSIEQKEQRGTGHALMVARRQLGDFAGHLLVLSGDVPLLSPATLRAFIKFHRSGRFRASVLTTEVDDPRGYGRIVRDGDGRIRAIVEQRDADARTLEIREINTGIYVFHGPSLFAALRRINNRNAQGEYYLTDVVRVLVNQGEAAGAFKLSGSEEVLGINNRKELAETDRRLRQRKCDSLMEQGVSILDPDTTRIDLDVRIGRDTAIHPSVQIEGSSVIGESATIRSFSRLTNARVGARSTVLEGCVIVDTELGADVSVGPYAHLRMGTILKDRVKVGNFVEVKKSTLGRGTKSMHLTYLGDATIGKDVNIGAGTITCNYDGVNKNPTFIEDGVFVGSDTQLIAPVRIGQGAYIGAGSSITDDVPPESLAIARSRQTVKEGWARSRKKSRKS